MTQSTALVHLAWALQGGKRHLIFGWIEIFPPGYPNQSGHPYVSMDEEPIPGVRIYIARFPMSQSDAEAIYECVAHGRMVLPSHPAKSSPGDGQPITTGLMEAEPPGGQECLAMGLPFVPAVHGGLHFSGLFGIPDMEMRRAVLQPNAVKWLTDNLYFPFGDYPEYIGAMLRVRHDPIVRTVEQHLSPRDDGTDDEVIRISTWPGANVTDCEILAVEQRPFGIGAVIREKLAGPVHVLHWKHKIEHTGIAIIRPNGTLSWWREPLPYIRSIRLGVTPIGRRKLIELRGQDGTLKDRYEVQEGALASQSIIGERPNPGAISSRYYSARQMRDQKKLRKSLGLRWFDDAAKAAQDVRTLIRTAQVQVWIVDPYFVGEPLVRFAFAAPSHVPVRILTSAKALKAKLEDRRHYAGQRLRSLLQEAITKDIHQDIKVWVMAGKEPPIHDRFLIIDNRVWLSGNSLNAVGDRPSVLVEVPDPQDIVEKLAPFQNDATPFEQWFADYTPKPPTLWERISDLLWHGE